MSVTIGGYIGRPSLKNITIAWDTPSQKFLDSTYPAHLKSPLKVGIEIECENGRATGTIKSGDSRWDLYRNSWIVKEDGSLRNHGVEFVTLVGMSASQASQALYCLKDVFKQYFPKIEANARTGVHIHLDFSEKLPSEVGTFILLYTLLERSLFKFSGGRSKNIFCVPIRESSANLLGPVLRTICKYPKQAGYTVQAARQCPKYAAFNLGALVGYGSIEFRHMAGTADPVSILPWLETLVHMYEYAEKQEFFSFLAKVKKLNTTSEYEEIALAALPNFFHKRIDRVSIIQDMTNGCAFIKECLIDPVEVAVEQSGVDEARRGVAPPRPPALHWAADATDEPFRADPLFDHDQFANQADLDPAFGGWRERLVAGREATPEQTALNRAVEQLRQQAAARRAIPPPRRVAPIRGRNRP